MHNQFPSFIPTSNRSLRPSPYELIEGDFVVTGVRGRVGRRGRDYRVITLRDERGQIRAFAHADCLPVRQGQTVQVSGRIRIVDGERELLIRTIQPIDQDRAGTTRGTATVDQDLGRLAALIGEIRSPYRALVEQIVGNEPLFDRFCQAPASTGHHHAYTGGLLHHSVEVMDMGLKLLPMLSVEVDASLLLTAGFLHDFGKIDAYTDHPPYELTARGESFGHEILGLWYLLPLLDQTPSLSPELSARLLSTLRLIPSHHTLSIPPEQEVLITLDGLSVQLSRVGRLMAA